MTIRTRVVVVMVAIREASRMLWAVAGVVDVVISEAVVTMDPEAIGMSQKVRRHEQK